MKWLFLVSFIAALFCSIFWAAVVIYVIATHRFAAQGIREVAVVIPLLFFIWGALEMFRSFRDARHSE